MQRKKKVWFPTGDFRGRVRSFHKGVTPSFPLPSPPPLHTSRPPLWAPPLQLSMRPMTAQKAVTCQTLS